MPQNPTARAHLLLQVWALSACLNACQPGVLINVDHLIQPTKINRDDRPGHPREHRCRWRGVHIKIDGIDHEGSKTRLVLS
jgi:hypothetical protein